MAIIDTVCGTWYQRPGRDTLDICPDCVSQNFAGAQPPLDWAAPVASETITITPRQVQAMHRMHERWAARSARPGRSGRRRHDPAPVALPLYGVPHKRAPRPGPGAHAPPVVRALRLYAAVCQRRAVDRGALAATGETGGGLSKMQHQHKFKPRWVLGI